MNFTKFLASVGNSYYQSFQQWYTSNPRTVGQFLHPVKLAIAGTGGSVARLSVFIERVTLAGTTEPLQRDHFCCFLAAAEERNDHGELNNYGEESFDPSSAFRWQRTAIRVQVPGHVSVRSLPSSAVVVLSVT